jgi:hypothetical protein
LAAAYQRNFTFQYGIAKWQLQVVFKLGNLGFVCVQSIGEKVGSIVPTDHDLPVDKGSQIVVVGKQNFALARKKSCQTEAVVFVGWVKEQSDDAPPTCLHGTGQLA